MSQSVVFKNEYNEFDTRSMVSIPRIGEMIYFSPECCGEREPILHKIESISWFPPQEYTNKLTKYPRAFDVMIVLEKVR